MVKIAQMLGGHHRLCDELFARCEAAAQEERWEEAKDLHARFACALDMHLQAEEDILFPAFESATGSMSGPTQVMREEHQQMRDILERLQQAALQYEGETFGDLAETLLILMQQHNLKEENILYPMCDRFLAQRAQELTHQLEEVLAAS